LAAAFLALLVAVSATLGGDPQAGYPLITAEVPRDALSRIGQFEIVSGSGEANVGLDKALDAARAEDFGLPGLPNVALVRSTGADPDQFPLATGQLVWVFYWGGLQYEYPKAFPGEDGKPMATVFVYTEYFVLVDAGDGRPISSIWR
jgi:hypothetical protein